MLSLSLELSLRTARPLLDTPPPLSCPSSLPVQTTPHTLLPIYPPQPTAIPQPPHGFTGQRNTPSTSTRKGHLEAIQVSLPPMWSSLQQTRTSGMHFHSPCHDALALACPHRHHVTCRHLIRPLSVQRLRTSLSHPRLATFAPILEKNHFVVHSLHAKNGFPAQMSSPVMRGYTATITAQQPRVDPAKKTRCHYPLRMGGMMRILRESLKRRPGAEQTVMTRCVDVEPLLYHSNDLHLTPRNPTLAQYIIPRGAPAHPFHCQPTPLLLPSLPYQA